jgi:uncharacterized protein (UPF0335 family)
MSGEGKTIPEADGIAVDQVRSAFKRWQNLEEEKARVADDLKELFAEQKGLGYNTKAMRTAFRLKVKLDEADPAEAEHEALVDTYLVALEAPRASRAYARENIEEFRSGGPSTAPTTLAARVAEESAVSNKPETAPHSDQPLTGGSNARQDQQEVDDFRRQALTKENDQTINHAGGSNEEVATGNAERVPTSNTGEGTANTALPANSGFAMEYVPPFGMKRLQFHGCFPDLSKAEYDRLEKDIAANRVQKPIIRQGDVIVDGWNRYNISRELGFNYPVQPYSGTDVLLDVIEMQRASRNFTPAQEKKIAADLAKEFPRRADEIMAAFGLAEALEAAE